MIKEKLKTMLNEQRYIHSMGVCETAVRLAQTYGADAEKAYTAGLVHDAAKNLTLDAMFAACKRLNVRLDEIEVENPALIHAVLGGVYIEEQFGITDKDIQNAVRYHTTGRAGMSMLEKIIYLADMIEPGRQFDGVEELRKLAGIDLDQACISAFSQTILFTVKKNQLIHPNTIIARNDLLLKQK